MRPHTAGHGGFVAAANRVLRYVYAAATLLVLVSPSKYFAPDHKNTQAEAGLKVDVLSTSGNFWPLYTLPTSPQEALLPPFRLSPDRSCRPSRTAPAARGTSRTRSISPRPPSARAPSGTPRGGSPREERVGLAPAPRSGSARPAAGTRSPCKTA